eukprot:6587314-Prymnesium_polylepis.1
MHVRCGDAVETDAAQNVVRDRSRCGRKVRRDREIGLASEVEQHHAVVAVRLWRVNHAPVRTHKVLDADDRELGRTGGVGVGAAAHRGQDLPPHVGDKAEARGAGVRGGGGLRGLRHADVDAQQGRVHLELLLIRTGAEVPWVASDNQEGGGGGPTRQRARVRLRQHGEHVHLSRAFEAPRLPGGRRRHLVRVEGSHLLQPDGRVPRAPPLLPHVTTA